MNQHRTCFVKILPLHVYNLKTAIASNRNPVAIMLSDKKGARRCQLQLAVCTIVAHSRSLLITKCYLEGAGEHIARSLYLKQQDSGVFCQRRILDCGQNHKSGVQVTVVRVHFVQLHIFCAAQTLNQEARKSRLEEDQRRLQLPVARGPLRVTPFL
jgi:hypothetical protein